VEFVPNWPTGTKEAIEPNEKGETEGEGNAQEGKGLEDEAVHEVHEIDATKGQKQRDIWAKLENGR
jgi:hypothetical protein